MFLYIYRSQNLQICVKSWRDKYATNVLNECVDECPYKVSSRYKMFNLLAMAIMSEKMSQVVRKGAKVKTLFTPPKNYILIPQ